jgi:hypothetical protein
MALSNVREQDQAVKVGRSSGKKTVDWWTDFVIDVLSSLWMVGLTLLLLAGLSAVAISTNWRQIGLSYNSFVSLEYWLRILMFLSLILGGVSCAFNAKFQDTEQKDGPSQTD